MNLVLVYFIVTPRLRSQLLDYISPLRLFRKSNKPMLQGRDCCRFGMPSMLELIPAT